MGATGYQIVDPNTDILTNLNQITFNTLLVGNILGLTAGATSGSLAVGPTGPIGATGNTGATGPGGGGTAPNYVNIFPTNYNFTPAGAVTGTVGPSMSGFGATFSANTTGIVTIILSTILTARYGLGSAPRTTTIALRFGTGTPPTAGSAATGTVIVSAVLSYNLNFDIIDDGVTLNAINTLTPGTVYWFDLSYTLNPVGGTFSPDLRLESNDLTIFELGNI